MNNTTLRKQAIQIYDESLELKDSGKASYFRQCSIIEAPESDRDYLKACIRQIGKNRMNKNMWNR
jgi:hypothetical protein